MNALAGLEEALKTVKEPHVDETAGFEGFLTVLKQYGFFVKTHEASQAVFPDLFETGAVEEKNEADVAEKDTEEKTESGEEKAEAKEEEEEEEEGDGLVSDKREPLSLLARRIKEEHRPCHLFGRKLRQAAGRGDTETVKALVMRGCDPNNRDGEGWCALHHAATYGQDGVIRLLSELCGEALAVDATDHSLWTPLFNAAASGCESAVTALIELGANVKHANKEKRTAVHWAASKGYPAVVELLLNAGAELDVVDESNWTALHCAMLHDQLDSAKLLLKAGADRSITDLLGRTSDELAHSVEAVGGLNGVSCCEAVLTLY